MMFARKVVRLERIVKVFEVVNVKEGDALCPDDVLVLVERLVVREGEHELGQFFVVALLHEHIAHAGDLVRGEDERLGPLARLV